MHSSRQVLGKPRLLLDERLIDQQLGSSRGQLHGTPLVHLLLQRTKVPLHPVNPDGQAVFQREVLGMLREHMSVRAWDTKDNFEFERRIGYRI